MEIKVAGYGGFCFGVKRAADMVEELVKSGDNVVTLGPIIHNTAYMNRLRDMGVRTVDAPGQCEKDSTLVVRSHGVGTEVYDEIKKVGCRVCDATCPFVEKIHKLVSGVDRDTTVIIAGDKTHPEVLGIIGHCIGEWIVIKDEEELKAANISCEKPSIFVAQTTFNHKKWQNCKDVAIYQYTNIKIFDTICKATDLRQREAEELAKQCDMMVVVGDFKSSNSAKLYEICSLFTKTVFCESAFQLKKEDFRGVKTLGITAGASTPAFIIKEVLTTMSEIQKDIENEEFSFEEALEASLKTVHNNQVVMAYVVAVLPNEVQVDIGTKHAGYVPANEISDDPTVKPEDLFTKGEETELVVVKVNDQEGTVMLSKKRLDAIKGYEMVEQAAENGTVLDGTVVEIIKGGVIVSVSGVRIFVPASHATVSRNESLDDLKGKKVKLVIIEMGKGRKRAVGSIKNVSMGERNAARDAFWAQAVVGQEYTGAVKSITSYGVFVDLGGVDGMIHISELSWKRIHHPEEVVKVGEVLTVYIKELDPEKKKISLGYKKSEDNPWEMFKTKFAVGDEIEGKVVSVTQFGAFVEIMDGIDGLVHISQISNDRVEKVSDALSKGDVVKAKIMDVEFDKKRISLSMKALLDDVVETEEVPDVQ